MATSEEMEGGIQDHGAPTTGITLLDGELVLANEHPDWSNWPKSIILGTFFVLVALGGLIGGNMSGVGGSLVVAAIFFGYAALARSRSRYIVTNQRVKKNVGLLSQSTGETRISDIRSLSTSQRLLERFFGKGTVQVDSTGAGGSLSIHGVKDHEQLANVIREQQRKIENS